MLRCFSISVIKLHLWVRLWCCHLNTISIDCFLPKAHYNDEENTCLKLSFPEAMWFFFFFFFFLALGLLGLLFCYCFNNSVGQVNISHPVCYCFIIVSSKFMCSNSLCWFLLDNCKLEFYYFIHCIKDPGSIPGPGRFPGEGNGNPLQYSCLENPIDGGTW